MGLAVLIVLTVQIILTALGGKLGGNNNRYANFANMGGEKYF